MEPIVLLVLAGVVGGLAMAFWLFRFNRAHRRHPFDAAVQQDGPTSIINMARIRVAGVGGLGMVLMALAVSLGIPQVGKSMAAGLLLGAVMAVVLIRRRRAAGPMPSSGQRPGANTTLAIDAADPVPAPDHSSGQHDAKLAAAHT